MKQGSLVLDPKQVTGMEKYEAWTGMYRGTANSLLKFLMEKMPYTGKDVLELGGRSGNFTIANLEYLDRSKILSLVAKKKDGFDSKGWLELAEVKFGFKDASGLMQRMEAEDKTVYEFLKGFMKDVELKQYKGRVEFINEDFFSLCLGKPYPIVVAHQFIHQFENSEQEPLAEKVAELTEKGGHAAFSSSMAFYAPTKFKVGEVSYLAHPFVQAYFEILGKKIEKETGKSAAPRAQAEKRTHEETIEIFERKGFEIVKGGYDEIQSPVLTPKPLFEFALRVAPENNGMFSNAPGMPPETKLALMNESIVDAVANHTNLLPTGGIPADVAPVFVFRRK